MATASLVRIHDLAKTFGEGETRVDAVRGLDLELEPDGRRLFFCSRGCRDQFLSDPSTPEGYTGQSTAKEAAR